MSSLVCLKLRLPRPVGKGYLSAIGKDQFVIIDYNTRSLSVCTETACSADVELELEESSEVRDVLQLADGRILVNLLDRATNKYSKTLLVRNPMKLQDLSLHNETLSVAKLGQQAPPKYYIIIDAKNITKGKSAPSFPYEWQRVLTLKASDSQGAADAVNIDVEIIQSYIGIVNMTRFSVLPEVDMLFGQTVTWPLLSKYIVGNGLEFQIDFDDPVLRAMTKTTFYHLSPISIQVYDNSGQHVVPAKTFIASNSAASLVIDSSSKLRFARCWRKSIDEIRCQVQEENGSGTTCSVVFTSTISS